MIQVRANVRICEGFANCLVAAPDLFDLDDDDKVIILQGELDDAERTVARGDLEVLAAIMRMTSPKTRKRA